MAIKRCTCENEQQNKMYGKGNRVCNKTRDNPPKYRCVVCLKEHS